MQHSEKSSHLICLVLYLLNSIGPLHKLAQYGLGTTVDIVPGTWGECFMFLSFPYSWLKEWKLRADREERKKQTDKKREEGSNGGSLKKNIDLFFFFSS